MTTDAVKVAVTLLTASIVTLHAPVPVHAPDQPAKVDAASGVALRLTLLPCAKLALHVAPQLMPPGLLVIPPVPAPAFVTVSAKFVPPVGTVFQVAVTAFAALMVTVQVVALPLHAPPHDAKLEPAAGAALRVTLAFWLKFAVQVAPQSIPAGLLETAPVPVPAFVTLRAKVGTVLAAYTTLKVAFPPAGTVFVWVAASGA